MPLTVKDPPLRIALVTQYFWPEEFRVNDVVQELTARGHEVEVLTGYPNYPKGRLFPGYRGWGVMREQFGGARVTRVPLWPRHDGSARSLVANFASLAVTATALGPFLLPRHVDVVLVYEPSPLTIAVPGLALGRSRRVPVVLWAQDLWPETLFAMRVATGRLRPVASRMSAFLHRRMDAILVQSQAFTAPLLAQGVEANRIHYVPNWAPDEIEPMSPDADAPEHKERPEGFVLLFAGNIGESQGLETILDAAEQVQDISDLHWVILGEGRRLQWVQDQVEARSLEGSVHLMGHRPPETMPTWFALADVLLITLRPEPVYELTVPSKLQAYLASGKPVLAALDGEGARIVRDSGAGLAVPAGDADALAAAARTLYALERDELVKMGRSAQACSASDFDRVRLIDRIEGILATAVTGRRRTRRSRVRDVS